MRLISYDLFWPDDPNEGEFLAQTLQYGEIDYSMERQIVKLRET
jgi:hypothetical protein